VWQGGTLEAQALKGKRVRATTTQQYYTYDGTTDRLKLPVTVQACTEAFVGYSKGTSIILAMSKGNSLLPHNLERLTRSDAFIALSLGWDEFRNNLEIDS